MKTFEENMQDFIYTLISAAVGVIAAAWMGHCYLGL